MKMSSDLRDKQRASSSAGHGGGDQRAGKGEGDWAHYMSPAQVLAAVAAKSGGEQQQQALPGPPGVNTSAAAPGATTTDAVVVAKKSLPPAMLARLKARGINVDAAAAAAAAPPALPEGWQEAMDPTHGVPYFFNVALNQTTWERPAAAAAAAPAAAAAVPAKPAGPSLPPGWEEAKDPDSGGARRLSTRLHTRGPPQLPAALTDDVL